MSGSDINKLCIYTLGKFEVKVNGKVLSDENSRSARLWELFKYIFSNRGKSIPPEVILETLWPNQEYQDPRRAARTLVHRLRHLLSEHDTKGGDYIKFFQSCYCWNTDFSYWADVDEFEQLCNRGAELAEKSPEEAIDIYKKALKLYQGFYLPESAYSDWVLPIKSYYHRLYLESLFSLVSLFKKENLSNEIIKICEKAFHIEPLDEELNIHFLEALISEKKYKQALSHYEYITSKLYKELGIKPSPALKNLYLQIKNARTVESLDISDLQQNLEDEETGGAFFCTPEVFSSLYKLEARREERSGRAVFLILITITSPNHEELPPDLLAKARERVVETLKSGLRRGDAVSLWNPSQFVLLLQGLTQEQAEKVLRRLMERVFIPNVQIQSSLQSLLPPRDYR